MQPLGIEVTEVVTGFVRSNILHHGLHAPEHSPYLPIKPEIERIKYEGNRNGMPAKAYAESVVDKLLRKEACAEIWEGKLSWKLGFLVNFFPLWFLVCSPRQLIWNRESLTCRVELVLFSTLQT